MAAKKIVKFAAPLGNPVVGHSCILLGVEGHYRLGTEPVVTTSYVIDIRDEGNTIETKNTIYQMIED